jgi:hypothetical protein
MTAGAPEGLTVPAPLVAPVVLLSLQFEIQDGLFVLVLTVTLSSCSHELVLAKSPDLPETLLGRFLRSVVSFLHSILDPRWLLWSLIC